MSGMVFGLRLPAHVQSSRYHPESNPTGNLPRLPKRWRQWIPKQQVDCGRSAGPRFDPQLPSPASSAAVTDVSGTSAAAATATEVPICTRPIYHQGGQVINKIPVALSMTPRLYGYVLQHTREHEVLQRLREATAAVSGSHMQITPEQGALLGLLVELIGARRVVEVGVFTGYSSCAMAMALPPDGHLVALDHDPRPLEIARQYWQLAGVSDRIDLMVGPAIQSLEALLARDGPASYDLAFIDADKRSYDTYYELLLQLVRPGGLIAIDNTLFYGRVVEPEVSDKAAVALDELNRKLLRDLRVSVSLVPIGDGMTLCRRKS